MARFSEEEKETIWTMREAGVPVKRIARHLGRQNSSLRTFIASAGGARPSPRERSALRLSLSEREEISRGLAAGLSMRRIAEGIGRAPSTVCREININGGPGNDQTTLLFYYISLAMVLITLLFIIVGRDTICLLICHSR